MKNNKKKLSISLLILLLFLLSSCSKSYPIIVYDDDIPKEERASIKKEYDEQLAHKLSMQQKNENANGDNTIVNAEKETSLIEPQDSSIDSDYISYEDNLDNSNTINDNNSNDNFPVIVLFKNQPGFDLSLYKAEAFEHYSDLDELGRVGKAEAMIGKETMPTTGRESIGMIKPTGWQTVKYDNIDGKYLYNRCHLIGWQLSSENKNIKNLFTGTRYLNVKGMLPFENQVANYIKTTGKHVLYRVTPYYIGNNLLVSHIQIEAMSFEDKGAGICFNVKLDNIQPGIHINYADGNSYQETLTNS